MIETIKPKPKISKEARDRITQFVKAVEALQEIHGISVYADDDTIALIDDRRKENFIMSDGSIYGQWDAQFYVTHQDHTRFAFEELAFEDFEGWDK